MISSLAGHLSSFAPVSLSFLHSKRSPQRWTLWDSNDILAGIQEIALDPHSSREFEFESPPSSFKTPQSNQSGNSPFNDPLTFYSYPSPQRPLNLTTIEERLGITRSDRYLPDPSPSQTITSSSRSSPAPIQPSSPPRTVCFLNQPQLTSEQEVHSSQYQIVLIDAHQHGKQFRSRTSLPPDSAKSLDSIASSLPLPQLSFGSITPIVGASDVYVSTNIYENRPITSTPYLAPFMSTIASTSQLAHF